MRIHLKNSSASFHPDPVWNDGALGFLWKRSQQWEDEEEEQDE